jgi:hypothetical protein
MTSAIRHFTDLSAVAAVDLRGMLDDAVPGSGEVPAAPAIQALIFGEVGP